jgi:glycosyltransferase involved in cell wall biosynthesis
LYAAYPEIKIVLIGSENTSSMGAFPHVARPWKLEDEIEAIEQFDIGIMPLPDDEYSQGKCGFKLLQYMALGIPSVASPIGVNRKIISHGINGFTASTPDEWFTAISALIVNCGLRKSIGIKARETVESGFNLQTAATRLVKILDGLN